MAAPLFVFKSAVVARRHDGGVLIALMNGSDGTPTCIALLECSAEAVRALGDEVRSALIPPRLQGADAMSQWGAWP